MSSNYLLNIKSGWRYLVRERRRWSGEALGLQNKGPGVLSQGSLLVISALSLDVIDDSGVARRRKVGGGAQTFFPKKWKEKKKQKKKGSSGVKALDKWMLMIYLVYV